MSINLANPVNKSDPLNRGLLAWYLALPSRGSDYRLIDLCGKYHGSVSDITYFGRAQKRVGGLGSSFSYDAQWGFHEAAGTAPSRMTVCCWVKFLAGSDYPIELVTTNESGSPSTYDRQLGVHGTGAATFYIYDGGEKRALGTTPITDGTWYWLAGTCDGSTVKVFVNGTEEGSTAAGSPYSGFAVPRIRIGNNLTSFVDTTKYLDDVRIYDRAMPADEIRMLYIQSRLGYPTALNRIRPVYGQLFAGGGGAVVKPRSLLTLGCGC